MGQACASESGARLNIGSTDSTRVLLHIEGGKDGEESSAILPASYRKRAGGAPARHVVVRLFTHSTRSPQANRECCLPLPRMRALTGARLGICLDAAPGKGAQQAGGIRAVAGDVGSKAVAHRLRSLGSALRTVMPGVRTAAHTAFSGQGLFSLL